MPDLERQFHSAGFFLVEPASRPRYSEDALLPDWVVSISPCICSLHPPFGLLSWVNNSSFSVDDYKKKLNLSVEDLTKAIAQTDGLFDRAQLGLDSVFCQKEEAKAFYQNFLREIAQVKLFQALIALKLSSVLINEMNDESPISQGIAISLKEKNTVWIKENDLIGYEVICYDVGGYHSFLCNSLEKVFLEKLNIRLNQHGLISSLEDAIRASDFCNSEESGAEPGYWLPCGLLEISLETIEAGADA